MRGVSTKKMDFIFSTCSYTTVSFYVIISRNVKMFSFLTLLGHFLFDLLKMDVKEEKEIHAGGGIALPFFIISSTKNLRSGTIWAGVPAITVLNRPIVLIF